MKLIDLYEASFKNLNLKINDDNVSEYEHITSLTELALPATMKNIHIYNRPGKIKLQNLKGMPKKLNGEFTIQDNHITSLEGLPKQVLGVSCHIGCPKVTTIEFIPEITKHLFLNISATSLEGIDKKLKDCLTIAIPTTTTSNILGLLKIQHLHKISSTSVIWETPENLSKAIDIINKHLPDKNILKCQRELIQNGLKDYAKF